MSIPDYQTLMLPVLQQATQGEVRISDVIDALADSFALTDDERQELLPSGKQTVFSNRTHWAKTYLAKAGLIESTKRAHFQITDRGRQVLAQHLTRIDNAFLSQFEEFQAFRIRSTQDSALRQGATPSAPVDGQTPDEVMRTAHQEIEATLKQDLLDRILSAPPDFFERLIVQLLVEMGYGGTSADAGRALGKSGDGGVDGVIDQDSLGLDRVYIQAKRYQPSNNISASTIREFFGSLDRFKAAKGVLVTTSSFTRDAEETASYMSKRIVLIDGDRLASLMIRHNVGCRVRETLHLKDVDEDFFAN